MTTISNLQPNTLCKNRNCKRQNGKRSFYYACKFCARTESWRSIACSKECFDEYVELVEDRRKEKHSKRLKNSLSNNPNTPLPFVPERTDMDSIQYIQLMNAPIEQAKEASVKEIIEAGYGVDLEELGLNATLEKINEDIKNNSNLMNTTSPTDATALVKNEDAALSVNGMPTSDNISDIITDKKPVVRRTRKTKNN